MTTIKDLIDAGRYPADEKNRPLVPMRGGGTATIYATDCPDATYPIAGSDGSSHMTWMESGQFSVSPISPALDLLPPPPRKVVVKAWAIVGPGGRVLQLRVTPPSGVCTGVERIVELTGEHEESSDA